MAHRRNPATGNVQNAPIKWAQNTRFRPKNWLRGLDLNQRPSGYEPDELPGCSTPRSERHPYYCRKLIGNARSFRSFLKNVHSIELYHRLEWLMSNQRSSNCLVHCGAIRRLHWTGCSSRPRNRRLPEWVSRMKKMKG